MSNDQDRGPPGTTEAEADAAAPPQISWIFLKVDAIIDLLRQLSTQRPLLLLAPCQLKPPIPTMDSSSIKETVMRQVQLESNTSNARMLIEVRPSPAGFLITFRAG